MTTPTTEATEWAAQLWTRPENAHREMDVGFAVSIAAAFDEALEARRVTVRNVEMRPRSESTDCAIGLTHEKLEEKATCGPCNLERAIELLTNVLGELDAIDAQLAELGGLPHMRGPVERDARDFLEEARRRELSHRARQYFDVEPPPEGMEEFDILVSAAWEGEDGMECRSPNGHTFKIFREIPENCEGLKVYVAPGEYVADKPIRTDEATRISGGDLD